MAAATQSATVLEEELATLSGALRSLGAAAAAELPDTTYVPSETLLADQAGFEIEPLLAEVDALQASLEALASEMAGREDGFLIPSGLLAEGDSDQLDQMLDAYSTPDGQAARLQVVLDDDPFSAESMDAVARLREQVSSASRGYVSGGTATNLDLQIVMDRDFGRVMLLVIGGILVVLVLLLRSLVAPVYMMLSILLSYGATMGVTRLVFGEFLGQGIAWFVPFLIFVVVVALGMDYNIFLMGRVKEEVARAAGNGAGNGTRAGIEHAVERTGGIITSAGIIMAGTFAAMMSSSLVGLVQLGFAVAFGVLLDTFIIRTTLVPALATLLGRWNWWPGKGPAARAQSEATVNK
jgi:RND superfamily putative drug exporter